MPTWSPRDYPHQELTRCIISAFYEVYNELGHGFVESVYERALADALRARHLRVDRQTNVSVWLHRRKIGHFRADLIVEDAVILELKAQPGLERQHEVQLLNLLRATRLQVGLLLNFGPQPQLKRLIFSNSRKQGR